MIVANREERRNVLNMLFEVLTHIRSDKTLWKIEYRKEFIIRFLFYHKDILIEKFSKSLG